MTDPTHAPAVRFMTVDPGHFHAALVHKRMYPGVSPRIDVYAPPGWDVDAHLDRLDSFNRRPHDPTAWHPQLHAGPDFFERMLDERPGNVVVLSGRNGKKIDYIERSVAAGLNVFADKPWIIRSGDFPRLAESLDRAQASGLVAYDMMTERYEVINALQRELVNDPAVFGGIVEGTPEDPAVRMTSVHHVLKTVAGAPLLRPWWFFDPREQGEALADVGTHLVDLSIWTLFPDEPLDHARDVRVLAASRWPTELSREQFTRVTGEAAFPEGLAEWTHGDSLHCACNTRVVYALRGTHVRLDVLWSAESPHGDTHEAVYRGERSSVEVRQGEEEQWRLEVYVVPASAGERAGVLAALEERVRRLQVRWPGLAVEERGDRLHVAVPDSHRLGHEHHFSLVAEQFLAYLADPASVPPWERACMLAKYFVTTRGTDLSHGVRG